MLTFVSLATFLGPSSQFFCDLVSTLHYAVRPVVLYMVFFLQFTKEQVSQKPDIDEDLRTMLLQAWCMTCGTSTGGG